MNPKRPLLVALSRPRALFLLWFFRLLAGWVIAAPLVSAVEGTGIGHYQHGDAALFEPGGLILLEVVRLGLEGLTAALTRGLWLFALFALLSIVALALWMTVLNCPQRLTVAQVVNRATSRLPSFFAMGFVVLLGQASLAGAGLFLLVSVHDVVSVLLSEVTVDLASIVYVAVLASVVLWFGVLHDLGRAACVHHETPALKSLELGFRVFARRPWLTLAHYLTAGVWSVVLVAAASVGAGRLAVESGSDLSYGGVWTLHQSVIIGLVVLRGGWLCAALRLTARPPSEGSSLSG